MSRSTTLWAEAGTIRRGVELDEAPSADLIRDAASRASLPADTIVPVSEIQASMFK